MATRSQNGRLFSPEAGPASNAVSGRGDGARTGGLSLVFARPVHEWITRATRSERPGSSYSSSHSPSAEQKGRSGSLQSSSSMHSTQRCSPGRQRPSSSTPLQSASFRH
jgi:hypothetical protein